MRRTILLEYIDPDAACRVRAVRRGRGARYEWEVWERVEAGAAATQAAADLAIGAVRRALLDYADRQRRDFVAAALARRRP